MNAHEFERPRTPGHETFMYFIHEILEMEALFGTRLAAMVGMGYGRLERLIKNKIEPTHTDIRRAMGAFFYLQMKKGLL